jgi:hypothetical protein
VNVINCPVCEDPRTDVDKKTGQWQYEAQGNTMKRTVNVTIRCLGGCGLVLTGAAEEKRPAGQPDPGRSAA